MVVLIFGAIFLLMKDARFLNEEIGDLGVLAGTAVVC